MSKRHETLSQLEHIAYNLGGAGTTRKQRAHEIVNFVSFLRDHYQLHDFDQIRTKHLQNYIASLTERGVTKRAAQNSAAHIRKTLRAAHPKRFLPMLKLPELSNAAIGIAGGSRKGTHVAIANDLLKALQEKLPPDLRLLSELQRVLGLRLKEAVCLTKKSELIRIRKELETGWGTVEAGTKGGRSRSIYFTPEQQGEILHIMADILQFMSIRRQSFLVISKGKSLKSAYDRARSQYGTAGLNGKIASHSLRYAWVRDRMAFFNALGIPPQSAKKLVALELGHGDSRARYVQMVYGRGLN